MSSQQALRDLIRDNVKLRDILPEYGIELDHKGDGRCPFGEQHRNGDAHPSLKYDDRHQRLYCNSVRCFDHEGRKGADIFAFIQVMEDCDFSAALQILADRREIHSLSNRANDISGSEFDEHKSEISHEYRDRSGGLIFTIYRQGKGGEKKYRVYPAGIKPADRILYRLPDLMQGEDPVVVVEGEKCVDALWEIGVTATTSPHGAGNWQDRFAETLRDRKVIMWPDKDQPGLQYGHAVYQSLQSVASSVRWVEPPDYLRESGDVVDVLEDTTRGGRDAVHDLINNAASRTVRPFVPTNSAHANVQNVEASQDARGRVVTTNEITLTPLSTAELMEQSDDISWHVEEILPTKSTMVVVAREGVGKTWMVLDLAIAISQGSVWLNHFPAKKGRVLIIDEENSKEILTARIRKLLKARGESQDVSSLHIQWLVCQGVNLSEKRCASALEEQLDMIKPDLVIFDSLVRIHRGDENDARAMADLFAIIKQWMGTFESTFVFCHHQGKNGMEVNQSQSRYRGSSEIGAFADSILDVRPTGKRDMFSVTHAKSRLGVPVQTFKAEILDVDDGATELRYLGDNERQNTVLADKVEGFLRELVANGEYYSRQDILSKGETAGHRRDMLDAARKRMLERDELQEERRGKQVGVKISKRSDVPSPLYRDGTSERSKDNPEEDLY